MTVVSLIASICAALGVIFGMWRYFVDRNRSIYERRLNEVYAPLYVLVIKQEMYREFMVPELSRHEYPILTVRVIKDHLQSLAHPTINEKVSGEGEPYLHRDRFIDACKNFGLARPKLLKYMAEFQLLVQMENDCTTESSEQRKIGGARVKVERQLLAEIVEGYEESIKKLKLNERQQVKAILSWS